MNSQGKFQALLLLIISFYFGTSIFTHSRIHDTDVTLAISDSVCVEKHTSNEKAKHTHTHT